MAFGGPSLPREDGLPCEPALPSSFLCSPIFPVFPIFLSLLSCRRHGGAGLGCAGVQRRAQPSLGNAGCGMPGAALGTKQGPANCVLSSIISRRFPRCTTRRTTRSTALPTVAAVGLRSCIMFLVDVTFSWKTSRSSMSS